MKGVETGCSVTSFHSLYHLNAQTFIRTDIYTHLFGLGSQLLHFSINFQLTINFPAF